MGYLDIHPEKINQNFCRFLSEMVNYFNSPNKFIKGVIFTLALILILASNSFSSYRSGPVIEGKEFNETLERWIPRKIQVRVDIDQNAQEYIYIRTDAGIGDAVIFEENTSNFKERITKALKTSLEFVEIARKNNADTTKSLGCFGSRGSYKCEKSGIPDEEGQMGLKFFSTNGGKQTDLILQIIDVGNQFFTATIYIEPPEIKKFLEAVNLIDTTFEKARKKAAKQDLFITKADKDEINRLVSLADKAMKERKLDKAEEYLAKAKSILPTSKKVRRAREKLNSLRAMEESLLDASNKDDISTIEKLLEDGVDINIKSSKHFSFTSLDVAVIKGNVELVEFLLKKGADPNVTKGFLNAVRSDRSTRFEIINLLLIHGVNFKKEEGESALIKAIEKGKIETVRLLLEKGVDPNTKTQEVNALHLTNNPEIIKLLRNPGAKKKEENGKNINGLKSADDLGLEIEELQEKRMGILVKSVFSNTLATKSGIEAGDIILAINHKIFGNNENFNRVISETKAGENFYFLVIRNDRVLNLIVETED